MVALVNKYLELQVYPRNDDSVLIWERFEPSFDDVDIFHSLMTTGKKISAIKYLRRAASDVFTTSYGKQMSISLKSAKEAVEAMAHDNHWVRIDVPEGPGFGKPLDNFLSNDDAPDDYGTYSTIAYAVGGGNGRVVNTFTSYNRAVEAIKHDREYDDYSFVSIAKQISTFTREWVEIKP